MDKFRYVSTASIVFLLSALVLIIGPSMIASEEGTDDGLKSLSFKIDGEHMGEPVVTQYWLDHINTENEVFRMTVTSKDEDEVLMEWIRNKEKKVFYKDIEKTGGTWQQIPNGEVMWQKMRNKILVDERDVVFWHENEGGETYVTMVNEDGEEEEVKFYDISVNEPIEESTFELE